MPSADLSQKEKRYVEFERNESVKVVRAYVACVDELAMMNMIWKRNTDMLLVMEKRLKHIESNAESTDPKSTGESAKVRIAWARELTEAEGSAIAELLADLRESLTAVNIPIWSSLSYINTILRSFTYDQWNRTSVVSLLIIRTKQLLYLLALPSYFYRCPSLQATLV
jgi:hypothetical protein